MSKNSKLKTFRAPDGTVWNVEVQLPGTSRALVVFHHPDTTTPRKNRYAWFDWRGPEASDLLANIDIEKVRAALDDRTIAELFKRSMLIGATGKGPALVQA
jgi:hypothetical protein